MIQVGTTITLGEVDKLLSNLALKVHDLRPVFRAKIDPEVTQLLREQFDSRGARLGTPWKPLSPRTIKARTRVVRRKGGVATTSKVGRARAGFATPLRDTNRLWASFTKGAGPEALRVFGLLEYRRGSRVPYAAAHNAGAPGVPARPIIPKSMPAPVLAAWEGYLVAYLTEGTL